MFFLWNHMVHKEPVTRRERSQSEHAKELALSAVLLFMPPTTTWTDAVQKGH